MDVGQAIVAAGIAVRQPLVIEAEEVQQRGVQVVDVDLVGDGSTAVVVGGAEAQAALDAAAGQPHRVTGAVVAAAVGAVLARSTAEFAAPQHQRVIQQAAQLQVGQEAGNRLVDGEAMAGHFPGDAIMVVPASVGNLNEACPGFGEAPRHQALLPKRPGLRPVDPI